MPNPDMFTRKSKILLCLNPKAFHLFPQTREKQGENKRLNPLVNIWYQISCRDLTQLCLLYGVGAAEVTLGSR